MIITYFTFKSLDYFRLLSHINLQVPIIPGTGMTNKSSVLPYVLQQDPVSNITTTTNEVFQGHLLTREVILDVTFSSYTELAMQQ